eukprot:Hpha_TRINITY_DN24295_c0_g1::TRINITY_DN24295_c0_g1_i1::g.36062::m.36062
MMRIACVVGVALSLAQGGDAKVTAAAVLPHGDFVYDPSLVPSSAGAVNLHKGARSLGKWLDDACDLIFLSTPHGLELSQNFLVYLNPTADGYAPIGQDLHNTSAPGYKVRMNTTTDPSIAESLVAGMGGHSLNVSGIKGFAGSMPLPISWGEIIPLSFVSERLRHEVVLLGQPLRRYNNSVEMVPELLRLGARLWAALEALPMRVGVVISLLSPKQKTNQVNAKRQSDL